MDEGPVNDTSETPLKRPDINKMQAGGFLVACVGLVGQFLNLNEGAQDNLTTICLAVSGFIFANDFGTKQIRGKIAHLFHDDDKSGTADVFENLHLAWKIAGWLAAIILGLIATIVVLLFV